MINIYRNRLNRCKRRNRELEDKIAFYFRETLFHEIGNFMENQINNGKRTDPNPLYS